MFQHKYKNRKLIVTLFFICLTIFMSAPLIIASLVLPETIHLIEGKKEIFDFNMPVMAVFKRDNVQAFKINEAAAKTDHIDLKQKFSVVSEKPGDAEVTLSLLGVLPVKTITVSTIPDIDVVPSGAAVGVRINTDGIMVLGTGAVESITGEKLDPAKNVLKVGDLILTANGEEINNKEQLTKIIENCEGNDIPFTIKRDGNQQEIVAKPIKSREDDNYKLGIWVRDSTQGIGTVTYYNPQTLKFGALGHGILDVDTKKKMSVKDGTIMKSTITSSKKGKKGLPGELLGNIENDNQIGEIKANTSFGIFGYINKDKLGEIEGSGMKIGLQSEVTEGEAYISSTIDGNAPKLYKVQIESINKYSNDESKGMIVKITDNALLDKTSGIVQGMSGSPIIQNNKLIGAVTHVFVQDPTKGYGIFIENMLKQEENI